MTEGIKQNIMIEGGVATVSRNGVNTMQYNLKDRDEASEFMMVTSLFGLGGADFVNYMLRHRDSQLFRVVQQSFIDASTGIGVRADLLPGIVMRALAESNEKIEFEI